MLYNHWVIHTLKVVRMRDLRVGFAGEDIDWFIISSISGYSDSPGMLKMEAAEKKTTPFYTLCNTDFSRSQAAAELILSSKFI